MPELTLAHSADADDVFMWWPITGMIDPAHPHDPSRLLSPPVLDTQGFTFRAVPEDIQVLNRRAIDQEGGGDLDITAISFGTLPLVAERYAPTVCGSSMGRGWGPKLVARAGEGWTIANASQRPCTIAIPGLNTSAFLVLSMLLEPSSRSARRWKTVVKPFHEIVGTVARGGADLGLLIHESQLTFQDEGLVLVADLGVWFNTTMKLPMPLGANVVRRDLDARIGPGTTQRVVNLLDASIRYALAHRADSLDYARRWSPLKDDASLNRYIDFYVNDLTLDCRPDGARAVDLLLARGAELGVLPRMAKVEWLAPTSPP